MIVAGLVLEDGGDETQAIAALLHDAAEDGGARPMLERIRTVFGDEVAAIVEACSDSLDASEDLAAHEAPRQKCRPLKPPAIRANASAGSTGNGGDRAAVLEVGDSRTYARSRG